MKHMLTILALVGFSNSVFAKGAPDCSQSTAIEKAAVAQAAKVNGRKSDPSVNSISFSRTTKDGQQDKYSVEMTVNEECLAEVYVYTDAGTCDVESAAGGTLQEGACG
jgi:uncharacterized protein YdeI (BOF family)